MELDGILPGLELKEYGKSVFAGAATLAAIQLVKEQLLKTDMFSKYSEYLTPGLSAATVILGNRMIEDESIRTGVILTGGIAFGVSTARAAGFDSVTKFVPLMSGVDGRAEIPANTPEQALSVLIAAFPQLADTLGPLLRQMSGQVPTMSGVSDLPTANRINALQQNPDSWLNTEYQTIA